MPPHNTSPNASSRKLDKVEFGQKLAKRRSQEFGAKVAAWNSTGGGLYSELSARESPESPNPASTSSTKRKTNEDAIITVVEPDGQDDASSDGEKEKDVESPTAAGRPQPLPSPPENTAAAKRNSRQVDLSRKAWVRRKSKTQADKAALPTPAVVEPDVKRAGTPKKRVISDGHWRRDRPNIEPVEIAIPVPSPLTIKKGLASVGLTFTSPVKSLPDRLEPKPLRKRHVRPSRSRSRSRSRERSATPDYESSGTKIYVKRREPTSRDLKSSTSGYTDISAPNREPRTRDTSPLGSPIKMRKHSPTPPNAVERYLNALAPAEFFDPNRNVPQSASPATRRKSIHKEHDLADKENLMNESPLPPASAPPKVFGTRIEGWLATTSDPFANTSEKQPDRSRLRHSSDLPSLRRPGSMPEPDDLTSSPTLKRRGARRTATSPVKDRAHRNTTPARDENQIQALLPYGSNLDTQTAPPHTPELARQISARPSDDAALDVVGTTVRRSDLLLLPSTVSHASDGDEPRYNNGLKRQLTNHSDLMSVLSVQQSRSRATRTRPSLRARKTGAELTIENIMNDVSAEELIYQRELRTLVDGVIPVLLQHVLSQSDVISKSKLLGQKTRDGEAVTKPIVDIGVTLERLKSLHKRIPLHNHEELLSWSTNAAAVYTEYLQVWRMGFQDIVVNLAPANASSENSLPHNSNNDVTNDNGERVDVAFLLKRPLVRTKHLAKAFEAMNGLALSSVASDMAARYSQLVQEAKRRSNEEKARLEDEAAAMIDPSRAREVKTLAPIAGVQIDTTRCVRARDFFDLDLRHSNGQQLNCKIELIARDDAPGQGGAGDLLFCEVSTTGRWLLFPPVHSTMISARKGRKERQLVVMLRGHRNDGREWREVMALEADDDEALAEWLSMLPATPIPRNLVSKSSFDVGKSPVMSGALPDPSSPGLTRMPSVKEIEVPIGERYDDASTVWDASEVNSDAGDYVSTSARRRRTMRHRSQPASTIAEEPYPEIPPTHVQSRSTDRPRPGSAHIQRQGTRPISGSGNDRPAWGSRPTTPKSDYSVWLPQPEDQDEGYSDEDHGIPPISRPGMHRRMSSVPSSTLPTIPKIRKANDPPRTPNASDRPAPDSAPGKLQHRSKTSPREQRSPEEHSPTQTKRTSPGFRASIIPSLTPAFLKRHRRSSSPLKHEYEPSTDSSSDSEVSAAGGEESFTSESAAEPLPTAELLEEEQISTVGELKSFPTFGGYKPMRQATPPESLYSPSDPSLAPSQSASQAPYRTVPVQEYTVKETTASIFAWAESGSWESLHPEECCIIVTPGLIEAFDNAQAHSAPAKDDEQAAQSPSTRGVKPLVALEMTPLVPLRRGTALDISIRSPPTANSLYKTGNNIMFRSRNAEECEALYHMLNRARIDNPTYIALQRARGPAAAQSNWGEVMDQRANARMSGSWWTLGSRKSTTYRSKALSRPQSIAVTESSVGTLNTAFSALRRFSGSNKFFNIGKSTITSRQGSRSTYSDSLDSGLTAPVVIDPSMGTPIGLTNMKIRLYVRETASKWRDMGAARLTILIPPRLDPTIPANPITTGREKRVIITGKTQGERLLDKTLGEACFERIARTGIAVSVWEENVDGLVATTGGVLAAKTRVYMIQMKSDREAAYTFGLVGKLRY